MRVLVTGGTGFIGSHVVDRLLARGDWVRGLVRRPDRPGWLKGVNVELAAGSLEDPGALEKAMSGIEAVVHLAGVVTAHDRESYFQANVEGTRRLLEAAGAAGASLRRFVTVGSQAAAGPSPEGRPVHEEDPPRPVTWYGESKLEAERLTLAQADRFPGVVVRPCAIYGPREREILTVFRLAQLGVGLLIGRGKRVNFLHVDDCVRGILAVLDQEAAVGRVFHLADDSGYSWEELLDGIESATGHPILRLRLSDALARGFGSAVGNLLARFGVPSPLSEQKLIDITQPTWLCSNARARADLGWQPEISLVDGLRTTARWYRDQGWL